VPAFEMGKAAAELLMNQIGKTGPVERKIVELEATLIPRASCGRLDGRNAAGSPKKRT
jgi:DNA-binding LacI/PurR family transcriptional regulator